MAVGALVSAAEVEIAHYRALRECLFLSCSLSAKVSINQVQDNLEARSSDSTPLERVHSSYNSIEMTYIRYRVNGCIDSKIKLGDFTKMSKQIQKLLIANRGEVACRIIKTAKKMGIPTIAIYSTEDSNSLHVRLADEAVKIAGHPTESYLSIPSIIDIAKTTGSDAVHPGFGFLSENHEFVNRLVHENILFVGPNAKAIKSMGDKLESKLIAKEAGVPCIPGHPDDVTDLKEALDASKSLGYPVILKAVAGGGGKGIRIIRNDRDLKAGFDLARNEAQNAFADSRLIIEKFVESAKHIEIQILADKYGNVVYFPERDCSVQRRYQKVIEESPSCINNPKLVDILGQKCLNMAKIVDYDSVGTFEFLIRGNDYYFLEMNTRLQVEHPLSEMVTGLDIVEQMLLSAQGNELKVKQEDLKCNGWAFESRIYAEDPQIFLPSSGQLKKFIEPALHGDSVRNDSGVIESSEISMYYDPMICKLLTHGTTRAEAREKMRTALDSFIIQGVLHNIPLLRDLYSQPSIVDGTYDTSFFGITYPDGLKVKTLAKRDHQRLLCIAAMVRLRREQWNREWITSTSDPIVSYVTDSYFISFNDDPFTEISIRSNGNIFDVGSELIKLRFESDWQIGDSIINASFEEDLEPFTCHYLKAKEGNELVFGGNSFKVRNRREIELRISESLSISSSLLRNRVVKSPMPGKIISIGCIPNSYLEKGQEICVIEAMKMQNVIKSPFAGLVNKLNIKIGDTIVAGQVILELQP